MIHHSLDLVRIHRLDNTLHCDRHGLLNAEEAEDVWQRSALPQAVAEQAGSVTRWQRVIERARQVLLRPHCVVEE